MGGTRGGLREAIAVTLFVAAGACGGPGPTGRTDPAAQPSAPATDGGATTGSPSSGGPQQTPPPPAPAPVPVPPAPAPSGDPPSGKGGILALDPNVPLPVPPDPADDPRMCTVRVIAPPDLGPQPDRPCTEDDGAGDASAYRYDASGRVVYRALHTSYGYHATFTSEDHGDTRVETLVEEGSFGRLTTKDVTELEEGKPVESDHFKAGTDGVFVLDGHTTWLYDDQGRQQYAISQFVGMTRVVDRNVYDSRGRPYFVDRSQYWPGRTELANHSYTLRSWFSNGRPAHEEWTCDIVGGAPCGLVEKRWEPCGNLESSANQTGLGRGSHWVDWTWDGAGKPMTRHDQSTTTQLFDTVETFRLDEAGRVTSGSSVTVSDFNPVPERHETSYAYDAKNRLVDTLRDGNPFLHARFDSAGRLVERTIGAYTARWTYDGCGR